MIWQTPHLARATRPKDPLAPQFVNQYVEWGVGPRAGQFLALAAKAMAAMEGLPTPGCQHVRRAVEPVLRHRVLVNYAATGEGIDAAAVVSHVLDAVKEPHYED